MQHFPANLLRCRRAVAGTGGDISRAVAVASSSQPDDESTEEGRTGRRGVGAGGGGTVPHGGVEELRQQLHVKWEAEKKLQKRWTCVTIYCLIIEVIYTLSTPAGSLKYINYFFLIAY